MATRSAKRARVTIKDVARAAGVSLGTASRALNRSGPVSEAAIEAVQAAVRRLGYAPDGVARSLRTRKTDVIGLLVSDIANPLYGRISTAIEARLQREGYAMVLANTHNRHAQERLMIDVFRSRRVDGLIMGPCEEEQPELLEQISRDLPVVALDRDVGATCAAVHADHFEGARSATRYLLDLGHSRIALMTSGTALRPGRERVEGYRAAFRERGLEPAQHLLSSRRSAMDLTFSDALALLSAPGRPTAFICLGTRILSGVLQAIRQMGLVIPRDVSVVCIGDSDLPQLFSPSITVVSWDLEALGTTAAELMLSQLAGAEDEAGSAPSAATVSLSTSLILRESCAAWPQGLAPAARAALHSG